MSSTVRGQLFFRIIVKNSVLPGKKGLNVKNMFSKSGNELSTTLVLSYVLLYVSLYILVSFKTPQNSSFPQKSLEI